MKKNFILISISIVLTILNVVFTVNIYNMVNKKLDNSYFDDLEMQKGYRFEYLNGYDERYDDSANSDYVQFLTSMGEISLPYNWSGEIDDFADIETLYHDDELMMLIKFKDNQYDLQCSEVLSKRIEIYSYREKITLDNGILLGNAKVKYDGIDKEVPYMEIGERVYLVFDENDISCKEIALSLKP